MTKLLTLILALFGFIAITLLAVVFIEIYAWYFVWFVLKEVYCNITCWWLLKG